MTHPTENPLDYPSYAKRKSSFTVSKWGSMPTELSPPRCASRGWSLEDFPCIICNFCDVRLTIALPSRDITFYKAKVHEFSDKLINAHKNGCIWKSTHCPDYFHIQESETESTLEDRVLEATKEYPDNFGDIITHFRVTQSPSSDLKYYANQNQFNVEALLVASHGWRYRTLNENSPLLTCKICCKRLPLWERRNRQEDEGIPSLDLGSHLSWCPWILSVNTKSTGLTQKAQDHISQSSSRKRKIGSKENRNSLSRMEELKDIKKFMKSTANVATKSK